MKLKTIAAVAALTTAACHAAYGATFAAEASGSALVMNFEHPLFCLGHECDPEYWGPWSGHLGVELTGSADGVYGGADVLSMTFTSTWGRFDYEYAPSASGPEPVVTLSGGRISDVEFAMSTSQAGFAFSGMQVSNFGACGWASGCNAWLQPGWGGSYDEFGTLVSVPEPTPILLSAVGLGLLAARRRQGAGRRD